MFDMRIFCFYFSIRLGAIIAGIFGIFQNLIPESFLLLYGSEKLQAAAQDYQNHRQEYDAEKNFDAFVNYVVKYPDSIITGSIIYVSVYVTIATLEIIGAYRLNKWLLCPFIAAEAIRWIVSLFSLCIVLVVLKKKINLGMLIGNSIAGAFILLALGYLWYTVASLLQIIVVVNSKEYKTLYGNDPLENRINRQKVVGDVKSKLHGKFESTQLSMAGHAQSTRFGINNDSLLHTDYYASHRNYVHF